MSNPQLENGYLSIANEIADRFCSYRLSGEEWLVLWVILRKTYGWHKKEDFITLSQFSISTNLKKQPIIRAIKKLQSKGIITVIQKDNGTQNIYRFNKKLTEWEPLSKKITTFIPQSSLKNFCYLCEFNKKEALKEYNIISRRKVGSNKTSNKIIICSNCEVLILKGNYTNEYFFNKKIEIESIECTVIQKDTLPRTVIQKDCTVIQIDNEPLSKKITAIYTKETNTKETIQNIYPQISNFDNESCKTDASTMHQPCMNDASLMQEPCIKNESPTLSAIADDIYKNEIPVVKSKKLKKIYAKEFEEAWDNYPHRPDDSKDAGFNNWNKKINKGEIIENLLSAVKNYKKYTEIKSIDEDFLIKFSNFFGRDNKYKTFVVFDFNKLKNNNNSEMGHGTNQSNFNKNQSRSRSAGERTDAIRKLQDERIAAGLAKIKRLDEEIAREKTGSGENQN
jgi:phage replication O-like protein O